MLKYLYICFLLCYFFLPIKYIHPELKYYYLYFKEKVEEECIEYKEPPKVLITFDNLKESEIGHCYDNIFGIYYIIKIDKNTWSFLDRDSRMNLLMHELSHCVLNADHVDNSKHYMYWNDSVVSDLDGQMREVIRKSCGRK